MCIKNRVVNLAQSIYIGSDLYGLEPKKFQKVKNLHKKNP